MSKEIRIKPIKNGTVIDHLNQGSIYKMLEVLHLREFTVTAAMNVESRRLGKKDIIFIEGKVLDDEELSKIALIGKGASVNVVKNSEIKKKFELDYPKKVEGIIKCINPKCISNQEQIPGKFNISTKPLMAKCHYCETRMNENEIVAGIKK